LDQAASVKLFEIATAHYRCGQLSLAPHFVQKVAEEVFCVPQVGQSFIPAWRVVVGAIGI
jgi:hypothetical protein